MQTIRAPRGREFDLEARIRRLPHYRLEQSAVRFMTSSRSVLDLDAAEAAMWTSLDSEAGIGALLGRHGSAFAAFAERLVESGVAVQIEPTPTSHRRRVLVVEPHADDAALSVGATMYQRRGDLEFTLLTACSRSNYTSHWHMEREYFSVAEVTALRCAESALFMESVHGRHVALDELEAPLRYNAGDWQLAWFKRHRVSVSANNNHRVTEAELGRMVDTLRPFLLDRQYEEIWFPLGVGTHSDHEMVRNACLRLMREVPEGSPAVRWLAYQDVPYDSNYADHTRRVVAALRAGGAELEPESPSVGATIARKMELLAVFASQFKVPVVARGVDASARMGTGREGTAAEHFWRFSVLPRQLDEQAMYIDEPQVAEAAERLRSAGIHQVLRRGLRVVLVVPAGRWRSDFPGIAEVCRGAPIEVYAFPAAQAEFDSDQGMPVSVLPLARGAAGWLRLVVHALRHPRRPVALVAGIHKKRVADRLGPAFPLAPYVAVESFDHLRQALARVAGETSGASARTAAEGLK